MNQPHDTGAFTTVSGMIGGVVKAISVKPVMMAITFGSLANVMIYAAASAAVGYVVKKALDKLADRINAKCNQWDKGVDAIENVRKKEGNVIVRYSEITDADFVVLSRSVKILK